MSLFSPFRITDNSPEQANRMVDLISAAFRRLGSLASVSNLTGIVTSKGAVTAIADGAVPLAKLAHDGAAGYVLTSNGADAAATFQVGGDATTSNPLSQFAATTSLQLKGVISDETGSGALVFANGCTLVAPTLGAATATSINKVTITQPATGSTLTIDDGFFLHVSGNAQVQGINTGDLLNSGVFNGRTDTAFKIAYGTLSGASSWTGPTWTAGYYRELRVLLRVTNSAPSGAVISLTGLSGTYKSTSNYNTSATPTPAGSNHSSSWVLGITHPCPMAADAWMDVRTGAQRQYKASVSLPDGGGSGVQAEQWVRGFHPDTTNGVSNLVITFVGGNADGDVELWGVPA